MLALDRDSLVIEIRSSAFTGRTSGEPVACVDLHGRLSCQNLQHPAALRGIQLRRGLELARLVTIYHPTIIVAFAILQGREILLDLGSDRLELLEVHRCSRHGIWLSNRNEGLIGRQIDRSVQLKLMSEDVSIAFSVEVELGVVGEVDHRRLV